MGYTHYFSRVPELDKIAFYKWASDVRCLLEHLPEHSESAGGYYKEYPLKIYGGMGNGNPTINFDLVSFNGDENHPEEDLSHETFYVERIFRPDRYDQLDNGKYFSFCKTERKPYDLLVVAALIRMHYHFGNAVEIGSDGDDGDWQTGMDLCREVFGEAILPPRIQIMKEEE